MAACLTGLLQNMGATNRCIRILFVCMEFGNSDAREVPDPYYGGPRGFELVLDMIEDAAQGLLRHIHTQLRH